MILTDAIATGNITTQNVAAPTTGLATAATANSSVYIDTRGASTVSIQVTGTYTGALTAQGTLDGTNWIAVSATGLLNVTAGSYSATITSATTGMFQVDVSGFAQFRVTANAVVTGTAVVTLRATATPGMMALDNALPTGANSIGTVVLGAPATATTTSGFKAEDAVHASADVGVMMLGVRYETPGTAPASAAGDYGFVQVDDLGKAVVSPYAPPVNQLQGITAAMTGTASTAVLASAGAGTRNYVTNATLTNTHATVGTEIDLLDGATIVDRIYVPALSTIRVVYNVPLKGTAATAFNAQNVTTGSNTYVCVTGFKAL